MINELYQLSVAMDNAAIQTQEWHKEYHPIPNIRPNAPCVKIMIYEGKIKALSSVSEELGNNLRKFGNKKGTYPCMNLAPLYRITDDSIKKEIKEIKPEDLTAAAIERIQSLCNEDNYNWINNFQNKYKCCLRQAEKLKALIPEYKPLQDLIAESEYFQDPE